MSELFDKSIRTLELPRVLQLLSEQAVSPEAKELALAVRPETDYEDVLRLLDQTDGARAMIVLRGAPGFSGVKPVKDLLDRADRGGSLNIPELIRIGDLLYAARRAKEYFNADAAESTALDQIFLSIGRRWQKAGRFCRRLSLPPAIPRFCRTTSSPSGMGALWSPSRRIRRAICRD